MDPSPDRNLSPASPHRLPPRPLPPRPLPPRSLPPRPTAVARPSPPPRPPGARGRPDPTGHRVALGFGGVAAASALVSAFLAPTTAPAPATQAVAVVDPAPVQHVTRYVQLLPGQTAPPNTTVAPAPAATPRVVVVTTRQSGIKL